MKTTALRLYGASDLRLETFELPPIKEDEILVEVISDSLCMSTFKCATLGTAHKRVPQNIATNPVIMGHEFAGNIVQVGKQHADKFAPGMKFTLQPALNYKGTMWSPGYSYEFFGGDATYCIVPPEVMELNCLLEYKGDAYFEASLAEPMSCSIGAFNGCYHTNTENYNHQMGLRAGGKIAILAGAGPMGLGAIDYALNGKYSPSMVVVTDIDAVRLARAARLFDPAKYLEKGIALHFVNTGEQPDPEAYLCELSQGGFDEVFIYAPVSSLLGLASAVAGHDCCINFFAGPTDSRFAGAVNFYDVHYNATHYMGTTGGNTADMIEALELAAVRRIQPACMVTHIGGLDSAGAATLSQPHLPGGKKLIYTHISMPLTAIADFAELGKQDSRYAKLAALVEANNGLWCAHAEKYLLENWK